MKRFLIFIAFSVVFFQVNAQTKVAKISFSKTLHDFGQIKEADGKAKYRFEFVNTGSSSLLITSVNATCGCTTPSWTKTPVAAGSKGYVDVTFNPKGYRTFTKSIKVTTNGEPATVNLIIKGNVVSAQASEAAKPNYKYDIGGVKFMSLHVGFGQIKRGQKLTKTIEIMNSGADIAELSFTNIPSHMTVKAVPAKLNSKEKGKIILTYDAGIKNDWDYVHDNVFVKVNGKSLRNNRLNISAVIKEDFSILSAKEKENAPIVHFKTETFNFGEIKQGEKVDFVFKLKNVGKSTLIIHKLSSSCGCTAVMPESKTIEPGKTVDIKAIFDSAHKKGMQNKSVTIITNDPKNSRKVLWVRGNVLIEE
ncbi:MAG: DUF1573 domain-containing protein [Bacteroidales bacterium]|nr:DUF1573 domain-containing protein [Bacteroidales bacterium]